MVKYTLDLKKVNNELELLKRIPKEHYTEYKGKSIQVSNLIEILKNGTATGNRTPILSVKGTCPNR